MREYFRVQITRLYYILELTANGYLNKVSRCTHFSSDRKRQRRGQKISREVVQDVVPDDLRQNFRSALLMVRLGTCTSTTLSSLGVGAVVKDRQKLPVRSEVSSTFNV
jgi:hypothetical protein